MKALEQKTGNMRLRMKKVLRKAEAASFWMLTFRMLYGFTENFVLPLSHDEVVHGKGSLIGRMPGDDWQRFANLRALLGYQWLFPGKKLVFMGGEFGQTPEWNANGSLDWWLLEAGPYHIGLQRFMEELNKLYLAETALWEADYDPEGFFWVDCSDHESSVLSFVRQNAGGSSQLLVVLNLTPVFRTKYRIGLPLGGFWREVLNSDSAGYGGSNQGNPAGIRADNLKLHNQPHSAEFTLAPMSVMAFKVEP
jgi:1,4-alpha-glucan branching enzyme